MAPTRRKSDDVPVSQEGVRRKVMAAIYGVEREAGLYIEKYLRSAMDPDTWFPYAKALCDAEGKNFSKLENFKDLDPLLHKAKEDPDFGNALEYTGLKNMLERDRVFECMAFSLRDEISQAYEKCLKKYCLSFAPEAHGFDLLSVREYENKIILWDKQIKEYFNDLDFTLGEKHKYEQPAATYLLEYDHVLHLMEETMTVMLRTCEPMKKWVTADAFYVRKIQDEISSYNRRKIQSCDIIKQLQYKQDQLGLSVKRRTFKVLKYDHMMGEAKGTKRFYKRRERELRGHYSKTEAEITKQRNDLEGIREKIKNRRENSPTRFSVLIGMVESLRDDIRRKESKLESTRLQMQTLEREQNNVHMDIDRLNETLQTSNREHKKSVDRLEQQEDKIRHLKEEIKSLDEKIITLKRIREIKLHADTVKKIYMCGYQPGQMTNTKGEIDLEPFVEIRVDPTYRRNTQTWLPAIRLQNQRTV